MRSETLFKDGAATKEQYDHAARALETANAQYSIAQAQVDTANAQLGVIEAQLLNTRTTAPISGTVAKKPLMPGELVQPGSPSRRSYRPPDRSRRELGVQEILLEDFKFLPVVLVVLVVSRVKEDLDGPGMPVVPDRQQFRIVDPKCA
jgi:multidrug efflux pump subunit AcrA (membrane-fusion protein)